MFVFMLPVKAYGHTTPQRPYEIIYHPDTEYGPLLAFKGNFVSGLTNDFRRAITKYPDAKLVTMHSPGGLVTEAYALGQLFSDNSINVWVPRNEVCLSACALAFVGGTNYRVSGILGFHAAWMPSWESDTKLSDITSAATQSSASMSFYFAANGFRAQLYQLITTYTNKETFIYFVNTNDLLEFLMVPRTYEEYLTFRDPPPCLKQGGAEMLAKISRHKFLEILRNMGEFNVWSTPHTDFPTTCDLTQN